MASLHLAPGQHTSDDHLRNYTAPPEARHAEALVELRQQLEPMFVAVPEPWRGGAVKASKPHISQSVQDQVCELRRAGKSYDEIRQETGLCKDTIRRTLSTDTGW